MNFDELSEQADNLAASGDVERARQLLKDGLSEAKKHRNFAYAEFFQAELAVLDGEHQLAVEYHQRALRADPRNAMFMRCLGAAYSLLGHDDEAIEAYQKALRIHPTDRITLLDTAQCYERIGGLGEALTYYKAFHDVARQDGQTSLDQLNEKIAELEERIEHGDKEEAASDEEPDEAAETGEGGEGVPPKPEAEPEATLHAVLAEVAKRFESHGEDFHREIGDACHEFEEFASPERRVPEDFPSFMSILRRWSSHRPTLPMPNASTRGGGYFVFHRGYGIVVDPGPGFIENFYEEGFSVADIDAIIVTHAHPDHLADLEGLLNLIHNVNSQVRFRIEKELRGEGGKEASAQAIIERLRGTAKQVDLLLNFGAFIKCSNWLSLRQGLDVRDIQVMHAGDEYDLDTPSGPIQVFATRAQHHEGIDRRYSLGCVVDLGNFRVGFTGDTAWDADGSIAEPFAELSPIVMVLHVGTVERDALQSSDLESADSKSEEEVEIHFHHQHLGLLGTAAMIRTARPQLAVLSEFPQELAGLRQEIANGLSDTTGVKCLPGDVGLHVRLRDAAVCCFIQQDFVPCESIETYAQDDGALLYFGEGPSYEQFNRALADYGSHRTIPLPKRVKSDS